MQISCDFIQMYVILHKEHCLKYIKMETKCEMLCTDQLRYCNVCNMHALFRSRPPDPTPTLYTNHPAEETLEYRYRHARDLLISRLLQGTKLSFFSDIMA